MRVAIVTSPPSSFRTDGKNNHGIPGGSFLVIETVKRALENRGCIATIVVQLKDTTYLTGTSLQTTIDSNPNPDSWSRGDDFEKAIIEGRFDALFIALNRRDLVNFFAKMTVNTDRFRPQIFISTGKKSYSDLLKRLSPEITMVLLERPGVARVTHKGLDTMMQKLGVL